MPNINKANRQVCDVDIRSLDRKPVLFFETANTTTQALTGESVYATAKGVKRIAFTTLSREPLPLKRRYIRLSCIH